MEEGSSPPEYIYDRNTLYVKVGLANREQIRKAFVDAIVKLNIATDLKINVIYSHTGQMGWVYIWVSSPAVYFALVGKNLDGSERYEEVVVSSDVTKYDEKANEEKIGEIFSSDAGNEINWADIDEMTSQKVVTEKRPLDWLVTVEGYHYNEEQMEQASVATALSSRSSLGESSDEVPPTSPRVPTMGFFSIQRAMVNKTKLNPDNSTYTLVSTTSCNWITAFSIKKAMCHYVSDPRLRPPMRNHYKEYNSRSREDLNDTYPIVTIEDIRSTNSYERPTRIIRVSFDPSSNDAHFALYMTKKITLHRYPSQTYNDTRGPNVCLLVFNYERL